jgi:hypothetical protein
MLKKRPQNQHVRFGLQDFRKAQLVWQKGKECSNGFIRTDFFYHDTIQVKFIDRMYELMENNGFTKTETQYIIKTHVMKANSFAALDYAHQGQRALELWEYDVLRKFLLMDNEWYCKYEGDARYSYKLENSKLILESHWMPKFYMVINLENYLDYEVDFSKDKIFREVANSPKSDVMKIRRAFKECRRIMDWYFLKKTSRKVYPFDIKKMETLFKQKWYNNEVRLRIERTKYL